jgi:O-antigen/teichoic acid export membrane protein
MVQLNWSKSVTKGLGSPVATLTYGTVLSQSVVFVSTVIMGHLYSPEQFGFYAFIITVAGIFGLTLSKSLETFIVPAKSDEQADGLFVKGLQLVLKNWTILIVINTLVIVLVTTTGDFISINFKAIWLSILLAPLLAMYSLCYQLTLRNLKYKVLASRGPIQNSAIGASQWVLSHSSLQSLGLVLGEMAGRVIGLGFLLSSVRVSPKKVLKGFRSKEKQFKVHQPIMVNFLSIFFDLAAASALLVFVNIHFGDWAAGQVSMAQRIVVLPVVFLGVNFAQYFLSSGSVNHRNGVSFLRNEFDSIVRKLFLTALGIAVILFFSGSWILSIFLGGEWRVAGNLIRLLLPFMVVSFVWNPMSSYFYVGGLWSQFLKISTLRVVFICIGAVFAKITQMNLNGATMLIVSLNASIQIYGLYLLRKKYNFSSK